MDFGPQLTPGSQPGWINLSIFYLFLNLPLFNIKTSQHSQMITLLISVTPNTTIIYWTCTNYIGHKKQGFHQAKKKGGGGDQNPSFEKFPG